MSEFPNTDNATRLSDTATDPSIRELESQKLRQTIEDMRASVPESIRTHVRDATMDLEQRNHDLSRQIQERTNEINILQEQALRDEAQIARLNDTISSEGNEIQALQESLHSESDRILVLEKNLDVVPRQMSHMIEQLETENNDKGARIEELEAENNDRGARIEELEAENNDRGARIEELEAENNDRGARIEELEAENRTRDAHIGTLINQVTELKKLSNWQLIELQKLQESDDALPEALDKGAFLPEKLKDRATSATDLAKSRKKGKNKAHSKYDGCGSSSRRR
ncbi:hypothetical protein PENSTE_c010G08124 [Penicillium steckii]|uniref:Autophagy-related protein 16 domain-containing protein n=1 Tax=Penicillium steckii TaxID=303698 RepID=A0A1V6T8B2_9EURO|nr:hypothetical protein PENSTE_c010G08124 [Penicillium steckii]